MLLFLHIARLIYFNFTSKAFLLSGWTPPKKNLGGGEVHLLKIGKWKHDLKVKWTRGTWRRSIPVCVRQMFFHCVWCVLIPSKIPGESSDAKCTIAFCRAKDCLTTAKTNAVDPTFSTKASHGTPVKVFDVWKENPVFVMTQNEKYC